MSVNSKMTAIADKIRTIMGVSGNMGLDDMANNLGTVQADILSAFTAVGNKGGNVPSANVIGNLLSAIDSIPDGAEIVVGTYTVASKVSGSSTTQLKHNVGFIPRIFIMYRNSGVRPGTDYALTAFFKYLTDPVNGRGAGSAIGGRSSSDKNPSGHAKISLSGSQSAFKDTAEYSVIWGAYNSDSSLYLASGDTYTYIAISDWEGDF